MTATPDDSSTKKTARLLFLGGIIPDRAGIKTLLKTLGTMGVDAEIHRVSGAYYAHEQIAVWKAQGHRADILTLDLEATKNCEGIDHLRRLLARIDEECGADWRPRRIFFHSASESYFSRLEESEFRDVPLIRQGDIWEICNRSALIAPVENPLSEALDALLGTWFACGPSQEWLDLNVGPLTPRDAARRLMACEKPGQVLGRLIVDPAAFISGMRVEAPDDAVFFEFNAGAPGAAIGHVAFDPQSENPAPTALLLEKVRDFDTPPGGVTCAAVTETGPGADHVQSMAKTQSIPAVVGLQGYAPRFENGALHLAGPQGDIVINNGDAMTIESEPHLGRHRLYCGHHPIVHGSAQGDALGHMDFAVLLEAARDVLSGYPARFYAHASTPDAVRTAFENGADGIGLVRTEQMMTGFLKDMVGGYMVWGRIDNSFRDLHQHYFEELLRAVMLDQFPITVRLMDPSMHVFLPAQHIDAFVKRVGPENTRGVQACLKIKDFYKTQIQALLGAREKTEFPAQLKLLVPHVRTMAEMDEVQEIFNAVAAGSGILLGPMVETPEALKLGAAIGAKFRHASFGTNDLTGYMLGRITRTDYAATRAWMAAHNENLNPWEHLSEKLGDATRVFCVDAVAQEPGFEPTYCGSQMERSPRSLAMAAHVLANVTVPAPNLHYARLAYAHVLAQMER